MIAPTHSLNLSQVHSHKEYFSSPFALSAYRPMRASPGPPSFSDHYGYYRISFRFSQDARRKNCVSRQGRQILERPARAATYGNPDEPADSAVNVIKSITAIERGRLPRMTPKFRRLVRVQQIVLVPIHRENIQKTTVTEKTAAASRGIASPVRGTRLTGSQLWRRRCHRQ